MMKKIISLLNSSPFSLLEDQVFLTRINQSIYSFLAFAQDKISQHFKLLSQEELLNNLLSPDLFIKKAYKWSEVLRTANIESLEFQQKLGDHIKICRKFINEYLSKEDRVKIFTNKLLPYQEEVKNFLQKLTREKAISDFCLTEVTDLSSSLDTTPPGQFVYLLHYKVNEKEIKIIIKQKETEKIMNEYFTNEYLKLCEFKHCFKTSSVINGNFILTQYLEEAKPSSELFENHKLKKEYYPCLDYWIKKLAEFSAAFDLINKGDRYLGMLDKEIFGNYLVDKKNNLWPIDHEFVLYPSGPNKPEDYWIRQDYLKDGVELHMLHTLDEEIKEKYLQLFKKHYFALNNQLKKKFTSKEGREAINALFDKIFPPEMAKIKKERFSRSLEEKNLNWVTFIDEAYQKSKQHFEKINN